jgi:hypothetical protein
MAPRTPDRDPQSSVEDFDEVERVLRERFHQAVETLEPAPGTLDHLRRAVPARRRRRTAALAATAVSVFAVSAGASLAARGSFDARSSQTGGTNVGNLMTTATNDAPGGGSGHGPATPGGQDMTASTADSGQPPPTATSVAGSSKPQQPSASPATTISASTLAQGCQNSALSSVVGTKSGPTGGVTYETVVGTVKSACVVFGTPNLTVTGPGGAAAKVPVYKADQTVAPLLTTVQAGQILALQPGDRFQFQLAWVPSICPADPTPTTPPSSTPPSSGDPTVTATTSGATPSGPTSVPSSQPTPSGTPSSSSPAPVAYSVAYLVNGSQTAQSASFAAGCGAAIYVTAYFTPQGQHHTGKPSESAAPVH